MLVCLCKVVSDRQVKEAIGRGASTVSAIAKATRAGTDCGACLEAIAEILREESNEPCKPRTRRSSKS